MLSPVACSMSPSTFLSLPSSTNAVESLHRMAKGKSPDILKVALMSVYKNDMASALEHLAATQSIPTSFEHLTPSVRVQKAKTAQKARAKRSETVMMMVMVLQISAQTFVSQLYKIITIATNH